MYIVNRKDHYFKRHHKVDAQFGILGAFDTLMDAENAMAKEILTITKGVKMIPVRYTVSDNYTRTIRKVCYCCVYQLTDTNWLFKKKRWISIDYEVTEV